MKTFHELGVPKDLSDELARRGITAPFPIQSATIADALAGRDLCGKAVTGSGKTLAFAIPLALRAGSGAPRRPRALVLVPTRELAAQVADELRPLALLRRRSVATFYGGTSLSRDQRQLQRGVDIAIACPGRLADLVKRKNVDLRDVDFVVIDEADRMADMGFLPEVQRLLDKTSAQRQTLLFSATLDGDVDVLVRRYQRDPARHEAAEVAEERGDVRHLFWRAEPSERVRVTRDAVRTVASAIVFTRTKHAADRVARQLQQEGVTAAAIHGNRSQGQRERALSDFASGRVATLVATDVAARGIHVDGVGMVIHFDPPATGKDYIHRSGRTGRAGADGVVITLVAADKHRDVKVIQRALAMPQGVHPVALDQLAGVSLPPRQSAIRPASSGADRRGGSPQRHRPADGSRTPRPHGSSARRGSGGANPQGGRAQMQHRRRKGRAA
ncbi:MAG TPA: DEAD/DEAH box helicase [Egibacteraceae bacterium]|nr:DEAD/DEAH box helicase [Egibacteraceae bacterium]